MKYCINDDEGKLIPNRRDSLCNNCLLLSFPVGCCQKLNICNLTHTISKSENTSSIFTL